MPSPQYTQVFVRHFLVSFPLPILTYLLQGHEKRDLKVTGKMYCDEP